MTILRQLARGAEGEYAIVRDRPQIRFQCALKNVEAINRSPRRGSWEVAVLVIVRIILRHACVRDWALAEGGSCGSYSSVPRAAALPWAIILLPLAGRRKGKRVRGRGAGYGEARIA
jgi:hypothetical protein